MDAHLILSTLDSLHVLSGLGLPTDAGGIARRIARSPTEVAAALLHLERRGLANASRARLTMAGLAAAVTLSRHSDQVRMSTPRRASTLAA
jgi:hypothetical protein